MIFFNRRHKSAKPTAPENNIEQGLSKTRKSLFAGIKQIFTTNNTEIMTELETSLLLADVGVETTKNILTNAQKNLKITANINDWLAEIKQQMLMILRPVAIPLSINSKQPLVILVVGVNGAGKTTTIGKMAQKFQQAGKSVVLAAGDTFRAAAVEQLQQWGEKNKVLVIGQGSDADSASVIFDAVDSARAKGIDIVIADTAGRLHTQDNLMAELTKISRVLKKQDTEFPHETMLVLDAGTGQNALSQVTTFNKLINLTGLVLTKMDGTAKGGIILALAQQTQLPIRYIGVGEGIDDLVEFSAIDFIDALWQ